MKEEDYVLLPDLQKKQEKLIEYDKQIHLKQV